MLVLVYLIFLVLGVKATWNFVANQLLPGIELDNIGFSIFIFVLIFLIVGPIMGVITSVKYVIAHFLSKKDNI